MGCAIVEWLKWISSAEIEAIASLELIPVVDDVSPALNNRFQHMASGKAGFMVVRVSWYFSGTDIVITSASLRNVWYIVQWWVGTMYETPTRPCMLSY